MMTPQMTAQVSRRPFTTEEYHRLYDVGVLTEDDRVELIDGEIIKMFAIGPRHSGCVKKLNAILNRVASSYAVVSVHDPVHLGEYSEPEPDLALLKPREDFYTQSHPTPAEILVAIEVADSSLESDRQLKLPTYAKAGIPEVWLVDLVNGRVEIHTQPAESIYQEVRLVLRGQQIISKAIPQLDLKADEVLG
ncbi:MAG: Uma2 family endonuclease [Blastocatellia bacterium]